jgi:hypothetical protein
MLGGAFSVLGEAFSVLRGTFSEEIWAITGESDAARS